MDYDYTPEEMDAIERSVNASADIINYIVNRGDRKNDDGEGYYPLETCRAQVDNIRSYLKCLEECGRPASSSVVNAMRKGETFLNG